MSSKNLFLLGLLGPVVALNAYSETYMSEQQAVSDLFPSGSFEKVTLPLSPEDVTAIEKKSGENVRNKSVVVYKNKNKDAVFIDQVLGKHDFITYALGITAEGKVKGFEILEYRESYGQQVRLPDWKNQFTGKDTSATLKVNKDIKNISGATLSSVHMTGGIRRMLQTYDAIRTQL